MSASTNRDEFLALVAAVAELLPGRWDLDPNPHDWNWGAKITDPDTGAILHLTGREDFKTHTVPKIEIRGSLPRDEKGQESYVLPYGRRMPEITVSSSKPAAQIARDIERRFLPEYLPLLAKAREIITSRSEYQSRTDVIARKLAAIVGVEPDLEDRRVRFYQSRIPVFRENMGEARVSDDEVTIEIRLPPAFAAEVLQFIKSRS